MKHSHTEAAAADAVPAPSADAVRAAREAAGLSQTAAGALCYRSLRAWQDVEAGVRNLDPAAWELFLLRTGQHPTHRLMTARAVEQARAAAASSVRDAARRGWGQLRDAAQRQHGTDT